MAVAGTLAVNLVLESQQFAQGMSKSQHALANFQNSAMSMGGTLLSAINPVTMLIAASTASAAYAFTQVAKQMEEVDRIAGISEGLGIATDKFVGLEHAALQTSRATSEDLQTALRNLNKQLGTVGDSASPAAKAFKQLGLDAAQLRTKRPDEAFNAIADAFQDMDDHAKETALAMQIFGKGGSDLLTTLNYGSEGLQRMQAQAELLGITFDNDAAAGVANFKDAQDRLTMAHDALWRGIAIELAPSMTVLTDHTTAATVAARHGVTVFGDLAEQVSHSAKQFRLAAEANSYLTAGLKATYSYLPNILKGVIRTGLEGYDAIHRGVEGFDAAAGAADRYTAALERLKAESNLGAVTFGTTAGFSALRNAMAVGAASAGLGSVSTALAGSGAGSTAAVKDVAKEATAKKSLTVQERMLDAIRSPGEYKPVKLTVATSIL